MSLFAATGAVAAAALGLGGDASPRLDAFNHFAPIWLLAGLGALIIALWLAAGRLRLAAILVSCLAVGANGARVVPEFAARESVRPAAGAERLKIIQFNAYVFNETPRRSVDWLIAQRADVVVLEEAGGLTRPEQLRLRAVYPHCSGCPDNGDWSNMILSTRAPIAQGRFDRSDTHGLSAAQGGWSRFKGAGGDYTVAGVHLAWPWLKIAMQQHAALAAFAASQPRARLIIAGDFNMTPWSQGLRRLDARLGLKRVTRGQGSWPAAGYYKIPILPMLPLPYLAIDQVYAGEGWRTVRVVRGPRIGSDHHPIVVELSAR